jgi:hypothetical protein
MIVEWKFFEIAFDETRLNCLRNYSLTSISKFHVTPWTTAINIHDSLVPVHQEDQLAEALRSDLCGQGNLIKKMAEGSKYLCWHLVRMSTNNTDTWTRQNFSN